MALSIRAKFGIGFIVLLGVILAIVLPLILRKTKTTTSSPVNNIIILSDPSSSSAPINTDIINTTALPSTALPSTALPSTALPSTALPSTALPSTALPSTALPSTTFLIQSTSDWYTAITDSQSTSPQYTTYQLGANLTFTSTVNPFLNSGTSDIDYLYIRAYNGINQTFDGGSFTITLEEGVGSSITSGFWGLFRIVGSSSQNAIIQNVQITSQITASNAQILFGSYSTTTTLSSTGKFACFYALFQNIITITSNAPQEYYNVIGFGNYLSFVNWCAESTVALTENYTYFIGTNGGYLNLTDCYFIMPAFEASTSGNNISVFSLFYGTQTNVFQNIYVYFTTTFSNTNNTAVNIINNIMYCTSSTFTNMFIWIGNYNTIQTNSLNFAGSLNSGNVNFTYVYTNNSNMQITSNSGTITGTITTSFIWNSAPIVSGNSFNTSNTPYQLQSFLTSPFNPSAYTSFSTIAAFA